MSSRRPMKIAQKVFSMELSIVIVNYNTKVLAEQTIGSILKSTTSFDYEIIVIDNSSDENERYVTSNQNIRFYRIENKGFGNACNLGSNLAYGKYLLFLNSDTIVYDQTLQKCIDYFEQHVNVGVLGCKIVLENGSLDHGCKRGFPTPLNSVFYFLGLDRVFPKNELFGAYRLNYLNENEIHNVESVSGAFLIISRLLFLDIKGFDEDFFMYGEDLDLCYRVKSKGLDIVYYADAEIMHLKGQSGLHMASKKTIYHFYDAMLIFYRKHYMKHLGWLLYPLIVIAVKLKYFMTRLRQVNNG